MGAVFLGGVVVEIQKVLVVDDDAVLLRAFRLALGQMIAESTLVATCCADALLLARQHRPQLAIVDLQLGLESGLDLLRELREQHPKMTIVIMSAYGSVDVAVRAIKFGANDFLEKPVTPREIMMRLRTNTIETRVETPSADRALWEHVHRVLGDCEGNKSEAARRLRRPRSWLRRFLSRTAPN
ncbi:MAG: response regulator [Kofleriaceae bacterium]